MIKNDLINDSFVLNDSVYPHRLFDAFGNNVRKWLMHGPLPADDTTNSPTDLIVTAIGAASAVTVAQEAGKSLVLTTDAAEFDGLNIQVQGEAFKLASGKPVYFGAAIIVPEATDLDLLVGLCELKTDLLKTSVAHGVLATNVAGVFFLKTDGATTIEMKAYKAGAQTFTGVASAAITKDVEHLFEISWDGSILKFYYDSVLISQISASLPDGDLTPSINFRAGSAAARVGSVSWMRCIQLR